MIQRFKPDKAFFRYLKAEYAKEIYGYQSYSFNDETLNNLLMTAYTITAYFKSKEGAKIVFSTTGVEEVGRHFGFDYFYSPTHEKVPEDISLRIFRKIEKERVELPVKDIEIIRNIFYSEGWTCPTDDMITRVFRHYRSWLSTGLGQQWVANNYKAIEFINHSKGVIYRCEIEDDRIYWYDENEISPNPKPVDHCLNCDDSYPCCDSYSGMGVMCNRCYSEHFGEPNILRYCCRHECRAIECQCYLTERQYYEIVEHPHNLPVQWTEHRH